MFAFVLSYALGRERWMNDWYEESKYYYYYSEIDNYYLTKVFCRNRVLSSLFAFNCPPYIWHTPHPTDTQNRKHRRTNRSERHTFLSHTLSLSVSHTRTVEKKTSLPIKKLKKENCQSKQFPFIPTLSSSFHVSPIHPTQSVCGHRPSLCWTRW